MTRSGASIYFEPPLTTSMSVIESEFMSVTVGDNLASGRNVLSE